MCPSSECESLQRRTVSSLLELRIIVHPEKEALVTYGKIFIIKPYKDTIFLRYSIFLVS